MVELTKTLPTKKETFVHPEPYVSSYNRIMLPMKGGRPHDICSQAVPLCAITANQNGGEPASSRR
jgi:hypothetical protein